jgi:hypothetical protein
MNLGTFCPLEKHWHILTPLAIAQNSVKKRNLFRQYTTSCGNTQAKHIAQNTQPTYYVTTQPLCISSPTYIHIKVHCTVLLNFLSH